MMSLQIIILLTMLMAAIFLVYKMYQTDVTSKTFILTVYLYIFIAMLLVALIGKYAATLNITDETNTWKMAFVYLIVAFSGIFLIFNDHFFTNHVGFLLLLLAISLLIGSSYRYSSNMTRAATITALIVGALTLTVFSTSEENLVRMISWQPRLLMILCGFLIVQLGMLFFGFNETFYQAISLGVIILFAFYVLSDTSKLIVKAMIIKQMGCQTHSCINYPRESTGLLLDYLNIFVNLLDRKR